MNVKLNERTNVELSRTWRIIIISGSLGVLILSSIWLLWTGHLDIRYSADHNGTIPIWQKWVPALVCILLICILPARKFNDLVGGISGRALMIQSWILLLAAVLFAILVFLVRNLHDFQLWYIGIKLSLLLVVPLVLWFYNKSRRTYQAKFPKEYLSSWRHWTAAWIIVSIWMYLSYFFPWTAQEVRPSVTDQNTELALILFIGFLMNSVLEETFYRISMQSRLEMLMGRWPAIFIASILWAIWHIAIQNTGNWNVDIAVVIANHGITGIFLGYLWSKYRNQWVIIAVHGFLNAPPQLILNLM